MSQTNKKKKIVIYTTKQNIKQITEYVRDNLDNCKFSTGDEDSNKKLTEKRIEQEQILGKIMFYTLRDFEYVLSIAEKLNKSRGSIINIIKDKSLLDATMSEVRKVRSRESERLTANEDRVKKKKDKYSKSGVTGYRLEITYVDDDTLDSLSERSKKIMYIFLQPDFMRKNVFNDVNKINSRKDNAKMIIDYINNFLLWNFQNEIFEGRAFINNFKDSDLKRKNYIKKISKDIEEDMINSNITKWKVKDYKIESDFGEYIKYFFDTKFIADIIVKLSNRNYLELFYTAIKEKLKTERDVLVRNKLNKLLDEIDSAHDWGHTKARKK